MHNNGRMQHTTLYAYQITAFIVVVLRFPFGGGGFFVSFAQFVKEHIPVFLSQVHESGHDGRGFVRGEVKFLAPRNETIDVIPVHEWTVHHSARILVVHPAQTNFAYKKVEWGLELKTARE